MEAHRPRHQRSVTALDANHPLSQFDTIAAKLRNSLAAQCLATRSGPVLTLGRVSGGSSCAERARTDAHGCLSQLAKGAFGELQFPSVHISALPRAPVLRARAPSTGPGLSLRPGRLREHYFFGHAFSSL